MEGKDFTKVWSFSRHAYDISSLILVRSRNRAEYTWSLIVLVFELEQETSSGRVRNEIGLRIKSDSSVIGRFEFKLVDYFAPPSESFKRWKSRESTPYGSK